MWSNAYSNRALSPDPFMQTIYRDLICGTVESSITGWFMFDGSISAMIALFMVQCTEYIPYCVFAGVPLRIYYKANVICYAIIYEILIRSSYYCYEHFKCLYVISILQIVKLAICIRFIVGYFFLPFAVIFVFFKILF